VTKKELSLYKDH